MRSRRSLSAVFLGCLCPLTFPDIANGTLLRRSSWQSSVRPGFISLVDSKTWLSSHSHGHQQVSAEYQQRNAQYAERARQEIPAAASVSEEMWLREVLPYQHFDEPVDDWRPMFYEKLKPQVEGATGSLKVLAEKVIPLAFTGLGNNVSFKSNQTPGVMAPVSQTLKGGFASCTGMSILVANTLRAVGVPARIAGIAQWNRPDKGNHNWVEVWTGDGWHFLDAVPTDKVTWDQAWFNQDGTVQKSVPGGLEGVYTPVWDEADATGNYTITWRDHPVIMPAIDRTEFYKALPLPH